MQTAAFIPWAPALRAQSCDAKDESTFERVDSRYIPKDGDCIRIVFAAPDAKPEIKPDRTVIPPEEATGTIEMDVTGDATPSFFSCFHQR